MADPWCIVAFPLLKRGKPASDGGSFLSSHKLPGSLHIPNPFTRQRGGGVVCVCVSVASSRLFHAYRGMLSLPCASWAHNVWVPGRIHVVPGSAG